jgi:hypothetical protein
MSYERNEMTAVSEMFVTMRSGILTYLQETLQEATSQGIISEDQAQAIYTLADES